MDTTPRKLIDSKELNERVPRSRVQRWRDITRDELLRYGPGADALRSPGRRPHRGQRRDRGRVGRGANISQAQGVAAPPMLDLGVVIYLMPPERLSDAHRRATDVPAPKDSGGQDVRQ